MVGQFRVDTPGMAGAHTWMILKGLEDLADVHALRHLYHIHACVLAQGLYLHLLTTRGVQQPSSQATVLLREAIPEGSVDVRSVPQQVRLEHESRRLSAPRCGQRARNGNLHIWASVRSCKHFDLQRSFHPRESMV